MKPSAKEFLEGCAARYESVAASVYPRQVDDICGVILERLESKKKIIAFGNGGSAALAMHFTSELVGRFLAERAPLPALCLVGDASALTAIGNDYAHEEIFARQIQAHGREGDIALGLSASGASVNVVSALERAGALGLTGVAMTGSGGGARPLGRDRFHPGSPRSRPSLHLPPHRRRLRRERKGMSALLPNPGGGNRPERMSWKPAAER